MKKAINDVDLVDWDVNFKGAGGEEVLPPTKIVKLIYEEGDQSFRLETKSLAGDTTTSVLPSSLWTLTPEGRMLIFIRTSPNDQSDGERSLLPDKIAMMVLSDLFNP